MASTGAADAEVREDEGESNRVSRERLRESGVPAPSDENPPRESGFAPRARRPAGNSALDNGGEHLELALAESARTEANLNSMLRGLNHLAAGARAARDANAALARELDVVRGELDRSRAEESVLRERIRILEQSLVREKRESSRERAAFIEQEDAFLAELLADHARELDDLSERLSHATDRVTPLSPPPPETLPPAMLGAVKLRTVRIPMPETRPEGGDKPSPPRPSSEPPLRYKTDPSLRPVGGYRLGSDAVKEEVVESTRPTSRPPPTK